MATPVRRARRPPRWITAGLAERLSFALRWPAFGAVVHVAIVTVGTTFVLGLCPRPLGSDPGGLLARTGQVYGVGLLAGFVDGLLCIPAVVVATTALAFAAVLASATRLPRVAVVGTGSALVALLVALYRNGEMGRATKAIEGSDAGDWLFPASVVGVLVLPLAVAAGRAWVIGPPLAAVTRSGSGEMPLANTTLRGHEFLAALACDPYFGPTLVADAKAALHRLCASVEAARPRDEAELAPLVVAAVRELSSLGTAFVDGGGELETGARDALRADLELVVHAYGFSVERVAPLVTPLLD